MAAQAGDGDRLFVTKIPPTTTKEAISEHFAQFGLTTDVYLPQVPGRPVHKGIAFISFAEPQATKLAMSSGPHIIAGQEVVVDIAAPRGQRPADANTSNAQIGAIPDRLFITKVPPILNVDHMTGHFQQFGELKDVYMPSAPGAGQHKGIAFVSFVDPEAVNRALAHQPHEVHGHLVVVDVAAPRGVAASPPAGKGGFQAGQPPPPGGWGKGDGWGGKGGKGDGWGGKGGYGFAPPAPAQQPGTPVPGRLFLTKVAPEITKEDLQGYFWQFGELEDVYLPPNNKGIAFVSYKDPNSTSRILNLREHMIKPGISVVVDQALDRPSLGGKGSGGGGGYDQGWGPSDGGKGHQQSYGGDYSQGGWNQKGGCGWNEKGGNYGQQGFGGGGYGQQNGPAPYGGNYGGPQGGYGGKGMGPKGYSPY